MLNNKYALISTMLVLSLGIGPEAMAGPTGGAVHTRNGAAWGGAYQGSNGQGGCVGVAGTTQGAGGCQGSYTNPETGASGTGQSRWQYSNGQFQRNSGQNGVTGNGTTFNRNTSGNYNDNTQTGTRHVNNSGTTNNGTSYSVDKNTTYQQGDVCRTVSGQAGTYQYQNQNNGQLACQ